MATKQEGCADQNGHHVHKDVFPISLAGHAACVVVLDRRLATGNQIVKPNQIVTHANQTVTK
jgi:hypothetical protein